MTTITHPARLLAACLLTVLTTAAPAAPAGRDRPNILLIVCDDLGYADTGFQGSKDIATPQLDRLANGGIRCTRGYVTHAYCSPSRAGLLTGRYQQRFGHENNVYFDPADHREGLPTAEKLLPVFLREAGYVTGWIGKWHLGAAPEFRPRQRGFAESFGFIGGGHHYRNWQVDPAKEYQVPIERNDQAVEISGHLTTVLGEEASAFVRRHQHAPWFLYLAFNAPHVPHEPTPESLARFATIKDPKRQRYAAQISLMDDAIGGMLAALRDSGQEQRTLVFFFSDNGGPLGESGNGSSNLPLRGGKGTPYEGGTRVPFLVRWPDALAGGKTYDKPVSSIDVFATALAAAGIAAPADRKLDSVDLLPHLAGRGTSMPHQRLFWRSGKQHAILDHDLKLVRVGDKPAELYDLANDTSEAHDLAGARPDDVARLRASLDAWESELIPPAFPGLGGRAKANNPPAASTPKS